MNHNAVLVFEREAFNLVKSIKSYAWAEYVLRHVVNMEEDPDADQILLDLRNIRFSTEKKTYLLKCLAYLEACGYPFQIKIVPVHVIEDFVEPYVLGDLNHNWNIYFSVSYQMQDKVKSKKLA